MEREEDEDEAEIEQFSAFHSPSTSLSSSSSSGTMVLRDYERAIKAEGEVITLEDRADLSRRFMRQFPMKSFRRLGETRPHQPSIEVMGLRSRRSTTKHGSNRKPLLTRRRSLDQDGTLLKYQDASLPSSPERQLKKWLKRSQEKDEMTDSEKERYLKYINHDLAKVSVAKLSKEQVQRIHKRLNNKRKTVQNIMLRKLLAVLTQEMERDHEEAMRKAVVDYVLMDPGERKRVNVPRVPGTFERSLIRAPVPWHGQYVIARQYCRHNLFTLNPVVVRVSHLWHRRYHELRFISPSLLRSASGDPLSPPDMRQRIFGQCDEARTILMKVGQIIFFLKIVGRLFHILFLLQKWLPEVAFTFVSNKEEWSHLIPTRKSDSVKQVSKKLKHFHDPSTNILIGTR